MDEKVRVTCNREFWTINPDRKSKKASVDGLDMFKCDLIQQLSPHSSNLIFLTRYHGGDRV